MANRFPDEAAAGTGSPRLRSRASRKPAQRATVGGVLQAPGRALSRQRWHPVLLSKEDTCRNRVRAGVLHHTPWAAWGPPSEEGAPKVAFPPRSPSPCPVCNSCLAHTLGSPNTWGAEGTRGAWRALVQAAGSEETFFLLMSWDPSPSSLVRASCTQRGRQEL